MPWDRSSMSPRDGAAWMMDKTLSSYRKLATRFRITLRSQPVRRFSIIRMRSRIPDRVVEDEEGGEVIRVISARKATPSERRAYAKNRPTKKPLKIRS